MSILKITNMKKIVFFVMIVFLFSNCNSKKDTNNQSEIAQFESILGRKNVKELNKVLNNFEKFLQEKYEVENDSDAFRAFVKNFSETDNYKISQMEINNITMPLNNNSLRNEIWLKPDSCWKEDNSLFCQYSYNGLQYNYRYSMKHDTNPNKSDFIILNKNGLFFKGLKAAEEDKYVADYMDAIEISGIISSSLFAGGLAQEGTDYSDYFVKRLILIEIYLKNYKW